MENLLKDMGKRIFDRRKQLNMTQETLAELAHVTPQTISTAELGQKAMRPQRYFLPPDSANRKALCQPKNQAEKPLYR